MTDKNIENWQVADTWGRAAFPLDSEWVSDNELKGNPKYDRKIIGKYGTGSCVVDVYRILDACEVTIPQLQHAAKKILFTGQRGHKDLRQDLVDILHSTQSALDMLEDKELSR